MPGSNTTLPDVLSYAEWMKGTSRILHQRSPALKAVDAALQQYERMPSAMRLGRLKDKFAAWKTTKGLGDAWKTSGRDKNDLATLLDQQLRGEGDTDVARGAQAFMEPALINSRLGAVYLFSHMDCSDSIFKVILHGAIDLTTASLDYGASGLADDDPRGVAMGRAKSGLSTAKGSNAPGKAADAIEKKIRDSGSASTVSSQSLLSTTLPPPPGTQLQNLLAAIKAALYKAGDKILETIRAQLAAARAKFAGVVADPGGAALEIVPGLLRKLCDFLAGKFLAAAVPFIGAGLDLAKGVANTIDSGVTKFKEWLTGRDVAVLAGHPGTIVEAIRRAMWFSVGEGLYDTLKGGLNLGLQFASYGASAIASLVVAVVEALVTTIWRLVEIARMRGFFSQAREYWDTRNESNALHLRPIAFNNWFKSYAVDMPALSVLALNSGICGDKMHFLKMFKDDTSVVSQAEFSKGCTYVDSLKVWGSAFLDNAGFSFTSEDPTVKGLLILATSHKTATTAGQKAWKATLGFLNA